VWILRDSGPAGNRQSTPDQRHGRHDKRSLKATSGRPSRTSGHMHFDVTEIAPAPSPCEAECAMRHDAHALVRIVGTEA
jgi:hypothetical protein